MKKVVDGKRYVFIQDGTVEHASPRGMEDPAYACRSCAACTEHGGATLTTEGMVLHNRLRFFDPGIRTACPGGYWVRDTKQAKIEAITRMLERA